MFIFYINFTTKKNNSFNFIHFKDINVKFFVMIKIIIVNNYPLIVEGLKTMIETNQSLQVIGIAINRLQTKELLKIEIPDIVFLDINLPDCNGIDLCRELVLKHPSIKVIGLSTFCTPICIQGMLDSRAKGYLLKNTTKDEIQKAINTVLSQKIYISDEVNKLLHTFKKDHEIMLTRREREVLQLLSDGMSNNEIAKVLFISPNTVDTHRTNLLAKFKTNNTALLIKKTIKLGFIDI
jgi:DNA-binding NarL/FixJ family response regulator